MRNVKKKQGKWEEKRTSSITELQSKQHIHRRLMEKEDSSESIGSHGCFSDTQWCNSIVEETIQIFLRGHRSKR